MMFRSLFRMQGEFTCAEYVTEFLYKDHVVELFDLDGKTRAKHLYEMSLAAEAVKNAFGADKMNYECLHIFTGIYFQEEMAI